MKLTNDRIAAQNRAARYLAQKQFEKEQKKNRDMDRFMAFVCGISVCVIVHFLGAL
jgi:hypothetical protein